MKVSTLPPGAGDLSSSHHHPTAAYCRSDLGSPSALRPPVRKETTGRTYWNEVGLKAATWLDLSWEDVENGMKRHSSQFGKSDGHVSSGLELSALHLPVGGCGPARIRASVIVILRLAALFPRQDCWVWPRSCVLFCLGRASSC